MARERALATSPRMRKSPLKALRQEAHDETQRPSLPDSCGRSMRHILPTLRVPAPAGCRDKALPVCSSMEQRGRSPLLPVLVLPLVGSVRGGDLSNSGGLFTARTRALKCPLPTVQIRMGAWGRSCGRRYATRSVSSWRGLGEPQKGLLCGISSIDTDFNARSYYASSAQTWGRNK